MINEKEQQLYPTDILLHTIYIIIYIYRENFSTIKRKMWTRQENEKENVNEWKVQFIERKSLARNRNVDQNKRNKQIHPQIVAVMVKIALQ